MDSPLSVFNATFENPPWEAGSLRILIVRLSAFRDVERSTPHLFLARAARRGAPGSYVDMAFLPPPAERSDREAQGLPLVLGIQSRRSLGDFDFALVSNSCIPELVNLPFLMRGSGIPLWASERDPAYPAIILGGSSSAAAQGIVRENGDCMADALFFGEGEGAVEKIAGSWSTSSGETKRERILALADRIPGLWPCGDLSRRASKAVRAEATPAFSDGHYPVLPGEEADTAKLEITLGCPCLCSFCFEGHDRKPFREIPLPELLRSARALKAASGARTLEISSFNFNTHEAVAELLLELNRLFLRVNVMSQRIDILSRDAGLLEVELAADKRSFTLGIEGISAKQRKFMHKSLESEDIRRVLDALHRPKVRELKLFFILTGREDDKDAAEFEELLWWLAALRGRKESNPRVILSFGLLVRMPGTPLCYDGLILEESRWKPLLGKVKSVCKKTGFEFRLSSEWTDYLLIQLLAMGGYEIHRLLERLTEAGIAYDRELPSAARAVIAAWMSENGDLMVRLSAEKPADYPFAFGFLETPQERAFLHAQYMKAKSFIDEGYCRKGKPGGCSDCPSCTLAEPAETVRKRPDRSAERSMTAREIAKLMTGKSRLAPVYCAVRIPMSAASSSPEWHAAYLLRELLRQFPDMIDNVLSIREAAVGRWMGAGFGGIWYGRGLAEIIAWNPAAVMDRLSLPPRGEEGAGFSPAPPDFAPEPRMFSFIEMGFFLAGESAPDPGKRILDALSAQHARFTIFREGGAYRIQASEETKRKSLLDGGSYEETPSGVSFRIEAGWKLDAASLFRAFPGARVEIMQLTGGALSALRGLAPP
jgi:hypothetical protein